jgi:V8-like Glu-specific endopeptidase
MRPRLAVLVAVSLIVLALPTAVGARSPGTGANSERASTLAYWTSQRMAHAIPRDFERRSSGKIVPKARPGSGSGGVTGASWTGDGLIETQSGRILFTMGGVDYICSGSVIDDSSESNGYSTVLTAGHCAFDDTDGWATNWMYIPRFDDAPTYSCANAYYGCWTATRLAAHHRFVTAGGFNDQAVEVDFSFARVGLGGKGVVGTIELDATTHGYGLKTSGVSLTDTLWAFGYPAAGRYHGKDLTYCKGSLVADPYGANTWGMACNMTGGSSGGPWLADTTNPALPASEGRVASLNSYGYSGLSDMFGPRFTSDTLAIQGDAIDGSATANVSEVHDLP